MFIQSRKRLLKGDNNMAEEKYINLDFSDMAEIMGVKKDKKDKKESILGDMEIKKVENTPVEKDDKRLNDISGGFL